MAERAAKIRRLATSTTASQSVLCQISQRIREMPDILDQPLSRFQVRRAFEAVWREIGYRERILCTTGAHFEWDIASLPRLLVHLTTVSVGFRNAFRQMWEAHPCTQTKPWSLVACVGTSLFLATSSDWTTSGSSSLFTSQYETWADLLKARVYVAHSSSHQILGCEIDPRRLFELHAALIP